MPVPNILLLPDSIDINQISEHQLFTAIPRFHRDKLAYLIFIEHYIRSISPTNVKKSNNYTKLLSTKLEHAVREYRLYYIALQTLGIMLCDNSYSDTKHISMGYLLNPDYKSDFVVEYSLTKHSIIKTMRTLTQNVNAELKQYGYLTKWFNEKLEIDVKLANQFYVLYKDMINAVFMKDWVESFNRLSTWEDNTFRFKYNEPVFQQYKIYRISHGYYPLSVDDTSHRLHTNLTSLKSELRNALTYNGKELVSLDLKNSQPYFSLVLLQLRFWLKPSEAPNEFSEWMQDRFPSKSSDGSLPEPKDQLVNRSTSLHINNFRKIALYLGNVTPTPNEMKELTKERELRANRRMSSLSKGAATEPTAYNKPIPSTTPTPQENEINNNNSPLITPLIMLVNNPQYSEYEDVKLYCKLVSVGKIYDYVGDECRKAGLDVPTERSALKVAVFQALYSANQFQGQEDAKPKQIFRKTFPNVTKLFEIIKRRESEQLPILLQSIESHLFLDVIAYRIYKERPSLPIFTIHDSIVTTKGNEEYVKTIMFEELSRAIGFEPTINIEHYNSGNLEEIMNHKRIDVGELYNVLDEYSANTRT